MQLELSSDEEFFLETTRRFLEDRCPPAQLRALRDDPAGYESSYWTQGAELGWTSLVVSEADGGGSVTGRGTVELTQLSFEFGRHASPGPLLPTNVVAAAVSRFGSHDLKASVLPGLLAGETVGAWAYAEPPPNDRLGIVTARAERTGGGIRVSGSKTPVEAGAQAAHILVTARDGDALVHAVVPADLAGVTVAPLHSLDVTRRYASVALDGAEIPASCVLDGDGERQADELLQLAIAVQLAEMVGAMDRCIEMTVDWAFSRYSFGRPLASYQELKHRFADMRGWLEAAHGITDAAIDYVQDGAPQANEYLSSAKAFLGDYGPQVVHDCVQMHGGIGVTYEHDLHLYLRRVVIGSQLLGSVADHRLRLATILEQREDRR